MRLISCLLTALLLTPALPAADGGTIQDAENAWAAAITKRDFVLLDKVLSPDLVYAHSTGIVDSKESYISAQKKGDRRYDAVTHLSMKTRQYGETAVVTGRLRMQGKTTAGSFDDTVLLTHVWVKQAGMWKLVAHQTTKVP